MKNDLIVPFIFCHNVNLKNYAWVFCKYADFSIKNDMPIITEEEYCYDDELIRYYHSWDPEVDKYTVPAPSAETLQNKLKSILISKSEKEQYLSDTDNEKRSRLLVKDDSSFEQLINLKLDQVEEKYGKIAILLTWVRYPALVNCAEKRGLKVLTQELSIIRGVGNYGEVLGYFNFGTKYSSVGVKAGFNEVKDWLDSELVLSRKELLALVLHTKHLDVLKRLNEAIYEFGLDADAQRDVFFQEYSDITQEEIIREIKELADPSEILARYHPQTKPEVSELPFAIDNSANSMEWILKCRRIVSGISNVGVEAMLLGRTAYVLCPQAPYWPGGEKSLKYVEDTATSIKFLNFILFGYFVPWDLMFDCEYIYWRAGNPAQKEIYKYNLSHMMKFGTMSYDLAMHMKPEERFETILSGKHGLKQSEVERLVKRKRNITYSEAENLYQSDRVRLLEQVKALSEELNSVKNSTSWKLTKPLRNIGTKARKVRGKIINH